jgi:hypothetical protein
MTDEVDITAPNLAKVLGETETTTPTLPPVKETVAALEPVLEKPATTLELEDDPEENILTGRNHAPVKTTTPMRTLDDVKPETPSRRKTLVKAPLRGDGFEGGLSAQSLPEAAPVTLPARPSTNWAINAAFVVLGLAMLGLLVWLFL